MIRTAGAYGITINLLNPSDGTQVARLTDTARRPEEILTVVRRQTLRLRESLGEPSATVERSRAILSRTWLPSIKALHLYTQAVTTINLRDSVPLMRAMPDRPLNGNDWAALEQLGREAVHEDPTFARAAVMLAYTIANQGRPREEFLPYAERALALAETATPQERYFILASFHQLRGGGANRPRTPEEREDLEKAVTAYESLFALQPDHYDLANNLRFAYSYLGRDRDRAWMDLRIAEARPRSVEENLGVANRMLREGNWDGARRFGGRAAAALSPASTAADPTQAATARLFDAYVAWLQDDPRSALSVVERVAATADRLRDADRDAFRTRLWPLYVALGRLRDAERTTDAMRRADGNDSVDTLLGEMAQAHVLWDRGDTTRFRELVGRWGEPLPPDFPPALSGRIESLIRAGFYENAERDLEQFKRRMQLVRLADGIAANFSAALERARGRPDAAIALFRKARTLAAYPERFLTNGQGQYYSSELASALETTGRLSEAIAVLEEAGADRVGIVIENALNRWLRGRAQLVRLYRKSGQVDEARGVEDQLLKLLAVADADHPLVAELKARRVADVAIVRSSRSTIK